MKNTFIILFLICFSGLASSQIQITKADYYSPGATIQKRTDSLNNLSIGQVLNNPLVFGDYQHTKQIIEKTEYLNPSEVQAQNTEFATSTCAFYQDIDNMGKVLVLQTITDEKVELDGMLFNSPFDPEKKIALQLEEKLQIAKFPIKLNSAHEDTGKGSYVLDIIELKPLFAKHPMGALIFPAFADQYEKVKVELDLSIKSTYDESATLKMDGKDLAQGEYEYLREKQIISIKIDLFLKEKKSGKFKQINECNFSVPGTNVNLGEAVKTQSGVEFPLTQSRYSYNYWTKGMKGAIAEISLDKEFALVDAISLRHSTSINIIEKQISQLDFYPNPAKENINVLNAEGKKIYIFDILGREMISLFCESNNHTVNVSNLNNGSYILKCDNQTFNFVVSK